MTRQHTYRSGRSEFVVTSPSPLHRTSGLLADRLIGLAGTPDDSARVGTDLVVVAQAAAATITAVGAVSVTGRCPQGFVTVAASDDVAVIVDEAQSAEEACAGL